MKFTFKNQPKTTGLGRVGYTKQSIDIKLNKKICGVISAPNWTTVDDYYVIRLMVYKTEPDNDPNCDWKWIRLKFKSENSDDCKKFLNDNIQEIISKFNLHFFEEE